MVTRLGDGIISTGRLNPDNLDKSISCLIKFKADCDAFEVSRIYAVGTSALREASDSAGFINTVRQKTGIHIRILTGEEEAHLTLAGVTGLSHNGPVLAIDIGGGSTEFILSARIPLKVSVPIGALKLYQKYVSIELPSLPSLAKMRAHINQSLREALMEIRNEPDLNKACVIITGGTPTTLAAIKIGMIYYDGDKIHGVKLSHSDIKDLFENLLSLSQKERLNIPGMEPERADIIISGTMIVLGIMEALSAEEITVSDYGLMEGIALTWD